MYTITLNDGKYTVINEHGKPLKFRRYGEAWPVADQDFGFANVVVAMADRIEELERAMRDVIDGEIDERGVRGCKELGIRSYGTAGTGIPLRDWESKLRNVLEQKHG